MAKFMIRVVTLLNPVCVFAGTTQSPLKNIADSQGVGLVPMVISILSAVATGVAIFAAVVALSFVSILVYIISQLRALHNERQLNVEALKNIAQHEQRISDIFRQMESMKTEIRDAALAARQKPVSDEAYLTFIREVMEETPTVATVNFLKDFIWRENITLETLKPVMLDKELQTSITGQYNRIFGMTGLNSLLVGLDRDILIRWAYEIKVKGKTIEHLVKEKQERDKFIQTLMGTSISDLANTSIPGTSWPAR